MKERGAIELIEEATLLVREAGLAAAGLYYIGALPFVLALLFFWSDMSSDAFAHQRVVPASFALALLLVWMNVWQAMYAAALYARAAGRPAAPVTIGRLARAAALHAAVQPTALLLLPIGAVLAIPFAWIYGFYQNFTALADGRDLRLWPLVAQSRAYAQLWTRQSWLALAIQAGFTLILAVNLAVALYMGPALLQSFLGIETAFTRSTATVFNSTFLLVVAALTYLCVDPVMKAIYTLRCFHAESVRSGADLRVEFRRSIAAAAIAWMLLLAPARTAAQDPPPAKITAAELDRIIDRVIHQRQYAWRLPRQLPPQSEAEKSFFVRITESALDALRAWLRQVKEMWSRFVRWLEGFFRRNAPSDPAAGGDPAETLRRWMYALLAAMACAAGLLVYSALRRRRAKESAAIAEAPAVPDLSSEDVSAGQLPEDGWRGMAREFLERGEYRLALRALYLAGLAFLADRQLILIHRAKTNRDYQKELERRARAIPELHAVFGQSVALFESGWYGRREIDRESVAAFSADLDRMRAYVR